MTTQIEWKVGGTVYFVPEDIRWRSPYVATVTKIGRKYATLGNGYNPMRADLESGRVGDNGYYYGRVWPSAEAYEENKRLEGSWLNLRRLIDNKRLPPKGVTEEDIVSAIKALKLL